MRNASWHPCIFSAMKVRRDKAISFCADGRQGERYLGYVEKSIATIAMYILERFEDANYIDFNIVAGSWGNETNARQDKVSFKIFFHKGPVT